MALAAFVTIVLSGCIFDPEEPSFTLFPDNGVGYILYPNDVAKNDSASEKLSHGVSLIVHPKASYELSFDVDSNFSKAPTLHLFEVFTETSRIVKIKNLKGERIGDRFVYRFEYEGTNSARYALTLEQNRKFYEGSTSNVRFKGEGAFSDHMDLNLIVVGNADLHIKDGSIQELATKLLNDFRRYYTSIVIDTLYLNYADSHPKLGEKYASNKSWIAGVSSDDVFLSELGGWPVKNALDIVLVYRIGIDGVMGYSNLYSGNMEDGEGSTVVISSTVKGADYHDSLTINEIVETAVHETGHFFGLRHTTSTRADMSAFADNSNYEDGFEDTPYCERLLKSGYMKHRAMMSTDLLFAPRIRAISATKENEFHLAECPDASNIMFPASSNVDYEGFSEEQLGLLRASLMIFPH